MATKFLTYLTFLLSLSSAAILPKDISIASNSDQSLAPRHHDSKSRRCWGDYSIDTNWYDVTPRTGVTREYWLVAENITLAPDVSDVMRTTVPFKD